MSSIGCWPSAEARFADARVAEIGSDTRFGLAYDVIQKCALAAMLARGYRPSTSEPGHHQTLIQALVKTAELDPESVVVLEAYRKLRNRSDYDGVPVGEAVAASCVESARTLLERVRAIVSSKAD